MTTGTLSVIIINYNTADFLEKCLESITAQTEIDFEIIVVDNASRDNRYHAVLQKIPSVKLIENHMNFGFAKANNQALKMCVNEYVFFLNPDTEVGYRTFKLMVGFMDANPDIGLAGVKIINPDGSFQSGEKRFYPCQQYAKGELMDLRGKIAWVSGAAMIARRNVIETIGGFDEDFFLYGEEQDLCLRIRRAGWLIGYIPNAVVVHWGGQSERDNASSEVWRKKFNAELIFYGKHYSEKTLRAIRRTNRIKAYWRIFSLTITTPFLRDKGRYLKKLEKYKLILDVF